MNPRRLLDPILEDLLGMKTARRRRIEAQYDTPVVRGVATDRPEGRHRWWFPEEAKVKTQEFSGHMGVTMPGKINRNGFLIVDGQGDSWSQIREENIPDEIKNRLVSRGMHGINTNLIGEIAAGLGYPGVHFKNIEDGGTVQDQYYVIDLSRRRSRFARFQDDKSDDIMAGLPLALLGGGAALGALGNDEET